MSNISDSMISIINSIALCENIQDYLEINCSKCQIIKDVAINNRVGYNVNLFEGIMIKLIKSSEEINLQNLLNMVKPEDRLTITEEWFNHLKVLNKEYNKLNKKQEIKSVEQYMSELSHCKDVKMQYPSSEELRDIVIETDSLSNIELPENGIILANLTDKDRWYLNGLYKLSENNLVLILSTSYIPDRDDLIEVDLTDFTDGSFKGFKKDNKYYLYVFRDRYLIDKYF